MEYMIVGGVLAALAMLLGSGVMLRRTMRAWKRLYLYTSEDVRALREAMEARAGELEESLDVVTAGVDLLLRCRKSGRERLERMEKLLSGGAGLAGDPAERDCPADRTESAGRSWPVECGGSEALPAEREAEMSRAVEEGVMNLLRYAAGRVPGVEVST